MSRVELLQAERAYMLSAFESIFLEGMRSDSQEAQWGRVNEILVEVFKNVKSRPQEQ